MSKCVFDNKDSCRALKEKDCLRCSFYKTEGELKEGRDKAAIRVAQLDPEFQNYIRFKHYGGRSIFKE